MLRLGDAIEADGIAVQIAVVGEHVDYRRGVFAECSAVINGHRIIVGRIDGQADRSRRGVTIGIGDGIGEAVGAVVVLRRGVSDGAVIVDGNRAMQRLGDAGQLEPAINGGVVGKHVDHRSGVFVQDCTVFHRHHRIIHRIDGDTDNRRGNITVGINNRVGEAVAAVVVGIRGINEIAVRVHRDQAMLGLGEAVEAEIAIGRGIIGQGIDNRRGILIQGRHIGNRDRHVIAGVNGQLDRCRRGGTVAVNDRIGEAVGAVVIGVRRIGHSAVAVDGHRAVLRLGNTVHKHLAAVHIVIVGHDVQIHRGIFVYDRRIVDRNRRVIDRIDGQIDARRIETPGAIGNHIGKVVGAIIVRIGGVGYRAVFVDNHRAVVRLMGDLDNAQGVAIGIRVVGRQVDDGGRILIQGHRIINGIRLQIDNNAGRRRRGRAIEITFFRRGDTNR